MKGFCSLGGSSATWPWTFSPTQLIWKRKSHLGPAHASVHWRPREGSLGKPRADSKGNGSGNMPTPLRGAGQPNPGQAAALALLPRGRTGPTGALTRSTATRGPAGPGPRSTTVEGCDAGPSYSQQGVLGCAHDAGNPLGVHVVVGELLWVRLGARLGQQEAQPVAHLLRRLGLGGGRGT